MVRLRTSFASYVTLCVVALHLVLLPALFFGMGYVIRKSHETLFIEHARTFARVLAEEFEVGVALDSPTRTVDLLDRKSTRLNSSHALTSRMPSSA